MSVIRALDPTVGKAKKNHIPQRDRVDMRAEPAWMARVERQAARLGISVTAYIKMATSRQLEIDEATDPELGGEDS